MKNTGKVMMAAAMALSMVMAGCSAAQDTKKKTVAVESSHKNMTQAFSEGDALAKAFKNADYSLSDLEEDADDISFEATGAYGLMEVEAEKGNAAVEYQELQAEYPNEDFMPENVYMAGDKELSVFLNQMNSMYDLAAYDEGANVVYSVESIPEADLQNVLSVFDELGFAAE